MVLLKTMFLDWIAIALFQRAVVDVVLAGLKWKG